MFGGSVTPDQLRSRQELLQRLDVARAHFESSAVEQTWKQHQQRTLDLLLSSNTTKVFDVGSEPEPIRARIALQSNRWLFQVLLRFFMAQNELARG